MPIVLARRASEAYSVGQMFSGLKRFQHSGDLHLITFSCYHRLPYLGTARARNLFENALETVRERYRLAVLAYVVMPEHVHLLLSEPARGDLAKGRWPGHESREP